MWEEGGVKYDSQISGVSVWVDEVANSEMETLEEEQILTRGGEWNEDLNFSHVKCEMRVKTSSKQSWSECLSVVLGINLGALVYRRYLQPRKMGAIT